MANDTVLVSGVNAAGNIEIADVQDGLLRAAAVSSPGVLEQGPLQPRLWTPMDLGIYNADVKSAAKGSPWIVAPGYRHIIAFVKTATDGADPSGGGVKLFSSPIVGDDVRWGLANAVYANMSYVSGTFNKCGVFALSNLGGCSETGLTINSYNVLGMSYRVYVAQHAGSANYTATAWLLALP